MIDETAMKRIEELLALYELRWGKQVDMLTIPSRCTQKELVLILERITDTGESVLVGWNKLFG